MASVKGADRVFISLAIEHNAPLITNDKQIHRYKYVFEIEAFTYQEFVNQI